MGIAMQFLSPWFTVVWVPIINLCLLSLHFYFLGSVWQSWIDLNYQIDVLRLIRNLVSVKTFNATLNNISVIVAVSFSGGGNQSTWRKPLTCVIVCKSLANYHIVLYQAHLVMSWIQTRNVSVIGTDCIGSCKFNYHTIMAPGWNLYYRNMNITYLIETVKDSHREKSIFTCFMWDHHRFQIELKNIIFK